MRQRFPVSNAGLAAAFKFLNVTLREMECDGALAHSFSVVLDEICANMIRHDPTLEETTTFALVLSPAGRGAELVISDPGQPFNPLDFRHKEQPEIGGHGITLIKGLASAVHYARIGDENHLTVTINEG